MQTHRLFAAALLIPLAAPPLFAAGYDGTQAFACSPIEIVSCVPDAGCEKETAETVNLPALLVFDVPAGKITGTRPDGKRLETRIDSLRHVQDDLALQGVQEHVLWSVSIAEASGRMALAAMGDGVGYIAFGGCALR